MREEFQDTKFFCAHHQLDTDAVIRLLKALNVQCDCEITLPLFTDKYDKYSANMGDNSVVVEGLSNFTCLSNMASREGDTRVTTTTNPVTDVTLMEIKADVLENTLTKESDREVQNYLR